MPLQATSGAASYDAFGGGAAAVPNYIEDVFSTWLYTGAGSTNQNIVNGIDLAGKGGLVWIKDRSVADTHLLFDTLRGVTRNLSTAQTGGQGTLSQSLTSFNSDGFTGRGDIGPTGDLMASWTFREQSKFFDVLTYTGNATNRTVSHNLGSVPGCIIVKRTDDTANWQVYHRSNANTEYMVLNSTAAVATGATRWNSTTPTDSVFSLGTDATVNASGGTYVAYLFAHNAGGFGLTGTDNVISCGSYTGNGSTTGPVINIGYEPQWLLLKHSSGSGSAWFLLDNMRGVTADGLDQRLFANESAAEGSDTRIAFNATGFQPRSGSPEVNGSGDTYIYIAIRRGPMKVPTDATKVFKPIVRTGTGAAATVTGVGFPPDIVMSANRATANRGNLLMNKLQGVSTVLLPFDNSVSTNSTAITSFDQNGYSLGVDTTNRINRADDLYVNWIFRRQPTAVDQICWTGTNSTTARLNHNLTSVPEFALMKGNNPLWWFVYHKDLGITKYLYLNSDAAAATFNVFGSSAPTSTDIGFNEQTQDVNTTTLGTNKATMVLFASCPGISKVGSFTGNGSTQTIDCGFTAGARFVIIKRTNSTGSWYVYDTARGMTVLNDPYLLLNSNAVEVATLGSVTTVSTGFALDSTILADINVNGGNYIFLAMA
jgi:hypothetical protein